MLETPRTERAVVEAKDLSFSYFEDRRSLPRRALRDVSFSVAPGTLFGVLGPNGSGKSTLFRLLSTALPRARKSARGEVTVAGHSPLTEPLAVRRSLGVVFQSPALDRHLTVEENLRHAGHLYGLSGASLDERIGVEMERFSIAPRRGDRVDTLSGGMQRRVELAKVLLHEPPVLLLDEPSTGLDPRARRDLRELLRQLTDQGVTVLLTTHFIEEAEACDRLLLLDQARVVAEGSPADLKQAVGGERVRLLTHDARRLAAHLETALGAADLPGAVLQASEREVRLDLSEPEGWPPPETGSRDLTTLDRLARVAALFSDWDERISEVRISRPSLEDVFLHHTGQPLSSDDGEAE